MGARPKFGILDATSGKDALDRIQQMLDEGRGAQARLIVETRQDIVALGLGDDALGKYGLSKLNQGYDGSKTTLRIAPFLQHLPDKTRPGLEAILDRIIQAEELGSVKTEEKEDGPLVPMTRPSVPAVQRSRR